MGILRLVEYGRFCDNPDCRHSGVNCASWFSRQQAEDEAIKDGWVQCTRKRWLCPQCAKELLKQETKP